MPRQRPRESTTATRPRILEAQGMSLMSSVGGRRGASSAASKTLGLSADYFREAREAVVLKKVKADPRLLDRYDPVRGKGK